MGDKVVKNFQTHPNNPEYYSLKDECWLGSNSIYVAEKDRFVVPIEAVRCEPKGCSLEIVEWDFQTLTVVGLTSNCHWELADWFLLPGLSSPSICVNTCDRRPILSWSWLKFRIRRSAWSAVKNSSNCRSLFLSLMGVSKKNGTPKYGWFIVKIMENKPYEQMGWFGWFFSLFLETP